MLCNRTISSIFLTLVSIHFLACTKTRDYHCPGGNEEIIPTYQIGDTIYYISDTDDSVMAVFTNRYISDPTTYTDECIIIHPSQILSCNLDNQIYYCNPTAEVHGALYSPTFERFGVSYRVYSGTGQTTTEVNVTFWDVHFTIEIDSIIKARPVDSLFQNLSINGREFQNVLGRPNVSSYPVSISKTYYTREKGIVAFETVYPKKTFVLAD